MAQSNPLNPYSDDPTAGSAVKIARPKLLPKSPALQQLDSTIAASNQAGQRAEEFRKKSRGIPLQAPVIREGRGSWSSTQTPAGAASVVATRTLGSRANDQIRQQESFAPALRDLTTQVRQETAQVRAQTAQVGANKLLANLGAAPIAPTTVRPMAPQLARPPTAIAPRAPVHFADVDPEPQGLARNPPQVQPAPVVAKPPSLRPGDLNTYTGTDGRTVAVPGTETAPVGPVPSQSFDAAPAVARPGHRVPDAPRVASTYGTSVLSMPDNNVVENIARPTLTLNSRGNGDSFRANEDREARQKLSSDLGSRRFEMSLYADNGGRTGRAAIEAMGDIDRQQSQLASGAEQLSTGAVQGQAQRDNVAALAEGQQRSEERRAQLGADVTREGNELGYQAGMAKVAADSIQRPELVVDGEGRYLQVGGDLARPILDAQGNVVRGLVKTDTSGQITPSLQYKALTEQLATLMDTPPQGPQEQTAYNARVGALEKQIQDVLTGAPAGMTVVGSSGGKPVYRDKDGKMHIGK